MGFFDADDDDSIAMVVVKLAFGVAMTVAVPFLAYATIKNFIAARASNSWPQAQATITRFEVTEDYLGKRLPSYKPTVEYRFPVEGKDYSGSRLAFRGHDSKVRSDIEEMGVKYAPGTQHAVYYDPADPTQSVIERGTHWLVYFGLVVPVVMLIVGPFMIKEQSQMLRRRASKKKNREPNLERNLRAADPRHRRKIKTCRRYKGRESCQPGFRPDVSQFSARNSRSAQEFGGVP